MKQPFSWDNYSDQPYQLKDKAFKKKMRSRQKLSLVKTALSGILFLPLSLIGMPFIRRRVIDTTQFIGLGVDIQREPQATKEMLQELGVENILVRLKLWELESIEELITFLKSVNAKKVTLKILQDREHIEDLELLKKDLELIFSKLQNYVDMFEVGSTINRAKWGFFSVDEYNAFFEVAYKLKQEKFPKIELLGSGVIDFEFHFTAHTLFNFAKYKYDATAALLYVDRRGAPENTQLGFSLLDKIALLSTMVWISPKTKHRLYITETNWPLSGTAPYAPTSQKECVSEELYAAYMLRYYLLAFASQQVDSVYWHQLIAPGYGLVDNRDGIRKTKAFEVFKYMNRILKGAQFLRLDIKRGYYILQLLKDEKQLIQIHWGLKETSLQNESYFEAYSSIGRRLKQAKLQIGDEPIYLFIKDAQ